MGTWGLVGGQVGRLNMASLVLTASARLPPKSCCSTLSGVLPASTNCSTGHRADIPGGGNLDGFSPSCWPLQSQLINLQCSPQITSAAHCWIIYVAPKQAACTALIFKMSSPMQTGLMPHWDLCTPSSLCGHGKVTIRLSQSSYIEWNTDWNALAWNSAQARRVAASSPGQTGTSRLPALTLGSIKPLLVLAYLERSWKCYLQLRQHELPSVLGGKSLSLPTLTMLKAGLTHQGPWLLRLAVGWQGEEWNTSSEGVAMSSEFY